MIDPPMMQMGFLMNLSLPTTPMYLDLQPADHRRIRYSTPKKATRQISWERREERDYGIIERWVEKVIPSGGMHVRHLH